MQSLIRDVPKPVIARVQGFAIGGGNVLATLCDLTIASEKAVFGQVGPKVGSVDPGFGTAYLARLVGEKRAREIWYLCRRYSAKEALDMGLVNAVVPHDKLDEEVDKWCAEIKERSPTAIAIAKRSFNADTEQLRGVERARLRGGRALLRHRGIEGGRPRLPRKAPAEVPVMAMSRLLSSGDPLPPPLRGGEGWGAKLRGGESPPRMQNCAPTPQPLPTARGGRGDHRVVRDFATH